MTTLILGHLNKVTKTKTYKGKRYYFHSLQYSGKSADKICKFLTDEGIPNLEVQVYHNGQSGYAIFVR